MTIYPIFLIFRLAQYFASTIWIYKPEIDKHPVQQRLRLLFNYGAGLYSCLKNLPVCIGIHHIHKWRTLGKKPGT